MDSLLRIVRKDDPKVILSIEIIRYFVNKEKQEKKEKQNETSKHKI